MAEEMTPELEANRNDDAMRMLLSDLRRLEAKVALGGGQKRLDKQHELGKMTAREPLAALFDAGDEPLEIGALAGEGLYEAEGGCPSGGVVVQIGRVHGRLVIAVANDATVKAGAWFPITGKKNMRAQEIAMENRLPIVYLLDSAGV